MIGTHPLPRGGTDLMTLSNHLMSPSSHLMTLGQKFLVCVALINSENSLPNWWRRADVLRQLSAR